MSKPANERDGPGCRFRRQFLRASGLVCARAGRWAECAAFFGAAVREIIYIDMGRADLSTTIGRTPDNAQNGAQQLSSSFRFTSVPIISRAMGRLCRKAVIRFGKSGVGETMSIRTDVARLSRGDAWLRRGVCLGPFHRSFLR